MIRGVALAATGAMVGALLAGLCAAGVVLRLIGGRDLPRMDCGCPDDGRPQYMCMACRHISCPQHRDDSHDCVRIRS